MPYTYTGVNNGNGWKDLPSKETPRNAANFNVMENGIKGAYQGLNELDSKIDSEVDAINQDISAINQDLQSQIDQLVVSGDSSPAAAQAAVGADGTSYGSLKSRLDTEYNKLASQLAQNVKETANATDLGLEAVRISQLLQRAVEGLKGEQIPVTLTNSLTYPFNNSKKTVNLTNPTYRNTKDYTVMVEVVSAVGGGVGDILITDKLLNGFKVEYTGAATSVSIICYVRGGM